MKEQNQEESWTHYHEYKEFHHILRVLCNIDSWELDNIFDNDKEWIQFRDNPWQWMITANEKKGRAVFDLAIKRHHRSKFLRARDALALYKDE